MGHIKLSPLGHTWLLDIDGTIVKHNGYKDDGQDTLLDGAMAFLRAIPADDMIIFISSRKEAYRDMTERFLAEQGIRYDHIIFDAPYGERILMNDRKTSGLDMAVALNRERDVFEKVEVRIDEDI